MTKTIARRVSRGATMNRRLITALTFATALGWAGVGAPPAPVSAGGDDKPPVPEARALLAKYCVSCHGEKKPAGGLDLASLREDRSPKDWRRVWDRVRSGQMPPPERPQPTAAERRLLTDWIEDGFARHTVGGQPDPGPLKPRRLNVREHQNTFRDLAVLSDAARPRKASYAPKPNGTVSLYHAVVPPAEHPCAFVSRALPPDTSDGGFDTVADNLSVPPFLVEKYLRAGKILLDDLFMLNAGRNANDQWPLYQSLVALQKGPPPKGLTRRQAVGAFLRDFASRAFRRPVTAEEAERYASLFDRAQEKGEDFESSIRLPLQAILASPRLTLLWADVRAEDPKSDAPAVRTLDDHDLAARLSYFLWSSLPDRELTQLARKGQLRDPKVIEQQVRRMLNDRRITTGLLEGFVCQWLQLDRLDRNAPDADRYPDYFRDNLGPLMKHEVLLFADAVLVEDRNILEFIDADWGFLCYPLARHYGVEDFPGKKPGNNAEAPWYRVTFPDRRRGGVLTTGKVLTGTSQPVRTSPVHRGKWLLEVFLGITPPPPPPDVDNVLGEPPDAGKQKLTVPQRLALHRDNPACASCHRLIDPLGMAFETFDPVGRWRDTDEGRPVDARGKLADGKEFDGVVELKKHLLARKDEFVRGFAEQMLAYALGRKLEYYDAAAVKKITRAVVEDGGRFSRVVVEVALSYPFRHRRVNGAAE